jgi:hypothetical protein
VTQVMAYLQPLDPVARLVGEPLTALRFLGMGEAKIDSNGTNGGQGPGRPAEYPRPVARPQLRLVVSNPLTAAVQTLFKPARPDAALGLVT